MSERIYAWLLKLYPARFREEYAALMLQLFRDRLQTERGVFRRFRFWLDVTIDLAVSIHASTGGRMPRHQLWEGSVFPRKQ